MKSLTETISIRFWQAITLLGMSGFAIGTILAKITTALGL